MYLGRPMREKFGRKYDLKKLFSKMILGDNELS